MAHFKVSSTVQSYPQLPYQRIKEDILGSEYVLSLVFIGRMKAKTLNKKYRKKMYVPNVLSFSLEKKCGEIYITPEVAKREAKKSGQSERSYIGFLFIHGLLHLKGYRHGDTMEKAEKKYLRAYRLA